MNLKKVLVMTGIATLTCVAADGLMAQNNGGNNGGRRSRNFDPAQFQQRMEQRQQRFLGDLRDRMGVTNDTDWKVIEARVQKVMEARRDVMRAGFRGMMFGGRRRGPQGGPQGIAQRPRGGFMGGAPMPQLEALDNAIRNKAPTDQIKTAMERYREARKAKEEALEKAQQDLKSVLTVRQEAVALSLGLVN